VLLYDSVLVIATGGVVRICAKEATDAAHSLSSDGGLLTLSS